MRALVAFERQILTVASDQAVAEFRAASTVAHDAGAMAVLGADLSLDRGEGRRDPGGRLLLTRAEADAIERVNETRPGFCSRAFNTLSLSKYCGIVRLRGEGATLEVVPKIWSGWPGNAGREGELASARRALLHMLARSSNLKVSELDLAPQTSSHTSLLDIFIRSFLLEALRVAKGGLLTRYVEAIDDEPTIRGRLMLVESERLAAFRPGLFRCSRDELTVDNGYNQVLLAAILVVRPHMRLAATERLWIEARAFFSAVSPRRILAREVASLRRGRETVRYEEALRWAELLLSLLAPSLEAGAGQAPAVLFDMEKLFERWVESREKERAPEGMFARLHGSSRRLAVRRDGASDVSSAASAGKPVRVFSLKPDVLLWREGADTKRDAPEAIVDAKWKGLEPDKADWGVGEGDIYQMLAYMTRYGCSVARLAYPVLSLTGVSKPPVFEVMFPNGEKGTISVDLIAIDT
ncbi:McrC family protein [Cupriavidus plantarum]|uniref:5-methylcytosine-specific restriction enzyme subunit McrC n=1 Tax=Cupriavidus plantarum TaxID=942865 RepID=A0A316F196_9BURK|nr:hypothetical protein [Cupriavidus plantarum]PWK38441.1 5-methylcytosine-specific restriction enzyme subunit McrC [Cupriavidus plantarum]